MTATLLSVPFGVSINCAEEFNARIAQASWYVKGYEATLYYTEEGYGEVNEVLRDGHMHYVATLVDNELSTLPQVKGVYYRGLLHKAFK